MSNEAFKKFLGSSAGIKATVQLRNCEIAESGFAQVIWQAAIAYMQERDKLVSEPIGWTNEIQLSYLDDGDACLVYPDSTECPVPVYITPQRHPPLKRIENKKVEEMIYEYTSFSVNVYLNELANAIMDEMERINK